MPVATASTLVLPCGVLSHQDIAEDISILSLNAYSAALADAAALGRMIGVHCVVHFGVVGTPGVSDLDVLVVCDDGAYREVVEASGEIVRAHKLCFVHQVFVLPLTLVSLRPVLFFPQTFNAFAVLAGDAACLAATEPSRELRTMATVIWGSTVWRILAGLLHGRPGFRSLLLLLQTIARQTALDRLLLGEEEQSRAVLHRVQASRGRILAAAAGSQEALIAALVDHIGHWRTADERLAAWMRPLLKSAPASRAVALPEGEVYFGPPPHVPQLYGSVARLLWQGGCPAAEMPVAWRRALTQYQEAAARAREWGERNLADTEGLFLGAGRGIFPRPFNIVPVVGLMAL